MHVSKMTKALEITGNASTAWLLERIAFWQQKATIYRYGSWWVANSHGQWGEHTSMNERKVERCFIALRRSELIASRQMQWNGKLVLHVQLTEKARLLLEGPNTKNGAPGHTKSGAPGHTKNGAPFLRHGGHTWRTYMEKSCDVVAKVGQAEHESVGKNEEKEEKEGKEEKEEKEEKEGCDVVAKVSREKFKSLGKNEGKEGKEEKKEKKEKKDMPTIEETLQAQKAKSLLHKPDTGGKLEFVWKEVYAARYKTYCPSFTQKQRGQLKMFAAKCPSGKAEQIIRTIVGAWVPFAHAVESAAGLKSSPDLPNLGFMLQYVQTAVSVGIPKPKQQEAAKVFAPLPSVQSIAFSEPEEPKMTPAELLAFINDPETP